MTATRILIAIGAVIVLGAIDASILAKERIKRDGEVVLLDLGPRDPRSLVQGDYMALRLPLVQEIEASIALKGPSADDTRDGEVGFARITLNERRVASLAKADAPAGLRIRYRIRKGSVWLGTNAFFFEEGSEARYAPARYGEFRLDPESGEAVLVGLRDAKFKPL